MEAKGCEEKVSKKKSKKDGGESATVEPKSKRLRRQKEDTGVCEEMPSGSSASKRVRAHLQEAKQKRLAKEAEEAEKAKAPTEKAEKHAGKVNKKRAAKDKPDSLQKDAAEEAKKKERSRKCCAYSKAYKATKGTEEEKRAAAKKVPDMHPAIWLKIHDIILNRWETKKYMGTIK